MCDWVQIVEASPKKSFRPPIHWISILYYIMTIYFIIKLDTLCLYLAVNLQDMHLLNKLRCMFST